MATCRKRGCAKIPSGINFEDTRKSTKQAVKTSADLLGKKVTLQDQTGMRKTKLKVENPLYGKR